MQQTHRSALPKGSLDRGCRVWETMTGEELLVLTLGKAVSWILSGIPLKLKNPSFPSGL